MKKLLVHKSINTLTVFSSAFEQRLRSKVLFFFLITELLPLSSYFFTAF